MATPSMTAQQKTVTLMLVGCRFCRASLADRGRPHERYIFKPGHNRTLEWREPYSGKNVGTFRWWREDFISQGGLVEIDWETIPIEAMQQLTLNNFIQYLTR